MASTSINLGKRLFFTVQYIDGSARIGTLDSPQKDLVELSNEELIDLVKYCKRFDLSDIEPDLSEFEE